jgi:ketosteroid isomerase-like protein
MQNTRCVFVGLHYLKLQIIDTATEPDVANDVPPLASIAGQLLFLTFSPGNTTMTEHSLWRFSRALLRAINERQFEDIELLIDEDIDWTIHGPVDMFPFLGARQGKAAVIEVIRQIAENFSVHRLDREQVMLGADSAASMLRVSLTARDSDKPISLRVAHFVQFKAERLRNIRMLFDSFDLVEQALGRPILPPRRSSFA